MAVEIKIEGDKKLTNYFRDLKRETSRLSAMANKRLNRLKWQGYEKTPAYREWESDRGGVKFGVKGKTVWEVQSEYWRVRRFLDDRTSTIRGANSFLKEMAQNAGIKYSTFKELKNKSATFFQMAQKISELDKTGEEAARALDYQKIWEAINVFLKMDKISLEYAEDSKEQAEIVDAYIDRFKAQLDVIRSKLK